MLNSCIYHPRVHLKDSDLDNEFKECPFCRSTEITFIEIIQQSPLIQSFECKKCHIGFISPQPTESYLTEYYKRYYESAHKEGKTTINDQMLAQHIFKCLQKQFDKEPKDFFSILDYGGGDGTVAFEFAHLLLENKIAKNVQLVVVDPNSGNLKVNDRRIELIELKGLQELNITFDIVIASAIMEHIKNPDTILPDLLTRLKKNGSFYARTPYIFPFVKVLKLFSIKVDVLYPGHLFDMGDKFWSGCMNHIGIKEKDFEIYRSAPSLVETQFKESFWRTLIAHLVKFPRRIMGKTYPFVGGWEVVIINSEK